MKNLKELRQKKNITDIEEKFHKAINDDMNMPLAMSFVWEAARFEKKNPKVAELLQKFDTVLGIEINKIQERKNEEISEEITNLLEQRKIAREQKEWSKSDEIRDLIKEKGYIVKDDIESGYANIIPLWHFGMNY